MAEPRRTAAHALPGLIPSPRVRDRDLHQGCSRQLRPSVRTKSEVIAIDEPGGEVRSYPPEVAARLREQDRESYIDIAAMVDAHPARLLNIQHEYGLFGGEDGEWLIDALEHITKPIVMSLHTVLPDPPPHHREVA